VARRRAETAFARDGVWPSLDAVVSYERFGLAGSPNPAGPGGSLPAGLRGDLGDSFESLGRGDLDAARVAVELGLPLFNRTARGNAAAARAFQRQAEADLARVRKAIRAEVLDAAAALETAGQRIEAARLGREAAEVQLSAERDRFASGMSTNFLVLTRQNDLSRARLDEISALTDYRAARTEMARATGTLAEGVGQDGMGTGR
jgi:outer membrane protein TolC